MPTNKHAAFRYRVLDRCFQRHRLWSVEDLADEVVLKLEDAFNVKIDMVSTRTIRADISLMKKDPPIGFEAPIECREGKYTYSDKKFSIERRPLSDSDIRSIKDAANLLRQFGGLPHFRELELMLSRVERQLKMVNQPKVLVQFETNPDLVGMHYLTPIWEALAAQKALKVAYQPFRGAIEEFHFSPFLLKEFRNRWFCFGKKSNGKDLVIVALDRITDIQPSLAPYEAAGKTFVPETHFQDFIGISYPQGFTKQRITFTVSRAQMPYLVTKPIHASQVLQSETATQAVFSLDIIPNYELASDLWRLGPDLLRVEPAGILESVIQQYRQQI